jgi:prolyl-tRNA editing enzyme YbaK/EbsC (Cys-tRNA(Pro) deacylase)
MMSELPKSAQRVQAALCAYNLALSVVEFPDSTHTAKEAADAIGCQVCQIAKSLVFKRHTTGTPVLIIASGSNRVNEKTLKALLGEKIDKADADFVQEQTGYAIGGIPPVGHIKPIETFLDEDLMGYDVIWAAAGTPHAVFSVTPAALAEITGGRVICIK